MRGRGKRAKGRGRGGNEEKGEKGDEERKWERLKAYLNLHGKCFPEYRNDGCCGHVPPLGVDAAHALWTVVSIGSKGMEETHFPKTYVDGIIKARSKGYLGQIKPCLLWSPSPRQSYEELGLGRKSTLLNFIKNSFNGLEWIRFCVTLGAGQRRKNKKASVNPQSPRPHPWPSSWSGWTTAETGSFSEPE